MRKPVIILLLMLLSAFNSVPTLASDTVQTKKHTLGANIAFGSADFGADEVFTGLGLHYNYQVHSNWDIELRYLTGDTRDAVDLLIFGLLPNNVKFHTRSYTLSAKGKSAVTPRSDLYIKLGINAYDYEMKDDENIILEKNGADSTVGIGWQKRFSDHSSFYIEYNRINFGDYWVITYYIGESIHF